MDGSNTNIVPEKEYVFSSTAVIGEKEYLDFQSVSYTRASIISLVFLILLAVCSVPPQFFSYSQSLKKIWVFASAWVLFVVAYLFFVIHKRVKTSYKRTVLSQGKEIFTYITHFGEKIVAETDQHAPVEYDYTTVTSIKETGLFYLLGLKYNVYLIVSKDVKSNSGNVDFVEYIFRMCPNIKKKKVKQITNPKQACIIYLCLFAALFLFHLIMFLR